MGGKAGRRRIVVGLVFVGVALGGSGVSARAQDVLASRGQKESLPGKRGPRVPDKLPAAAPAGSPARELGHLAVRPPIDAGPREYADSLDALAPAAAAYEHSAAASYSYCIRVIATYEHVYYGPSGELRREYVRAVQHGTGFAYKARAGESFVATNDHLANMPEVTGPDTSLDGVPAGSRKVREALFIVRGEDDAYTAGFIELTKVLSDPANDVAVLKTTQPLNLMPYRFGRSADLKVGNIVLARGYPLGVLATSNVGRVTSSLHEDSEGAWDHLDFITDAALNVGNSGSPVLAISRRTGEPELVGIFHAQYRNATGMGVVVSIDQIRSVLETLRPAPAVAADGPEVREDAAQALAVSGQVFFPFGGLTARALRMGAAVRFEIYEDFPTVEVPQVVIASGASGPTLEVAAPGGGVFAGTTGVQPLREPLVRLEAELWRALGQTVRLRRALTADDGSSEAHRLASRLRRMVGGRAAEQKQLLSVIGYETESIAADARAGAAALPRR